MFKDVSWWFLWTKRGVLGTDADVETFQMTDVVNQIFGTVLTCKETAQSLRLVLFKLSKK